MARLYPPITEETLPAFCLTYNGKGEKISASITINFNLNRAVANTEISGMALRLRTISTNTNVVTEQLAVNPTIGPEGRSEGEAVSFDLNNGICIFGITKDYNPQAMDLLKVGQYYKAQIAFINLSGEIGYWSEVATIKCVAKPKVSIANFDPSDINVFSPEIVGVYEQDKTTGDHTEKVYSYSFQLFDIDKQTIREETGVKLHNSSKDDTGYSSNDTYFCYQNLNENEIYYVQYNITTINGLKMSSPLYQIMNIGSIDPEEDIKLLVYNGTEDDFKNNELTWYPWEEGLIKIQLVYANAADRANGKPLRGNFVILRSSSKDNFTTWQEVKRFRINGIDPSKKIIYDYTVEQGITYKYAVQQYNRAGFYSNKVYADHAVRADFEDMFLYDGKKQLKIRFNPKVGSFKNDLQEQKIDTIGSKYPFIFRNGNVCYKEFPIGGLISFQEDNALFFIDDDDYRQMALDRFEIPDKSLITNEYYAKDGQRPRAIDQYTPLNRNILTQDLPVYWLTTKELNIYDENDPHENLLNPTILETKTIEYYQKIDNVTEANNLRLSGERVFKKESILNSNRKVYRAPTYNKNDLTSENIMTERHFKLAVLEWLTDGKPKLFRSPTEGNYIVRILNVNLTPKEQLGRMLHDFTSVAYEIADFDYNNLIELGLLTVNEPVETEYSWVSQNIKDLFRNINNKYLENTDIYYPVNLRGKEVYGFECAGFAPGDKIKITTSITASPLVITIGQMGSYIYENSEPITGFSICPVPNTVDLPRDLLFEVRGYIYQKFDMISSINIHTQKAEQIVGTMENFFDDTVINSSHDIGDLSFNHNAVNVKKYYSANNVYLSEKFVLQEDLSEEDYDKNWYYVKNNNTGNYYLPMDGLKKANYNSNIKYYKRIPKNIKLISTDILLLHAKSRTVVPIFMNSPNGDYTLSNGVLSNLTFMLTPYGKGYINTKSILVNGQYNWQDGVLSSEEFDRALSIYDIVNIAINKYRLDKFCLFQVYVPITNNNNGVTDWIPYPISSTSTFSGIFDPYLYEQKKLVDTQNDSLGLGWWDSQTIYDPSITFTYNDNGEQYSETVILNDKNELTIKNLKKPTCLKTGNGVMVEIFYRLKYIDYLIEQEDYDVQQAKINYINVRNNAIKKMGIYRTQKYFKSLGNNLFQNYNNLDAIVNDSEQYRTMIKTWAEKAHDTELDNIRQYLTQEKDLILEIIFPELRKIDETLKQKMGEDYIQNYSFGTKLDSIEKDYKTFLTITSNKSDSDILPAVSYYEENRNEISNVQNSIINRVNNYINNAYQNNSWNFYNLMNDSSDNSVLSILKRKANDKQQELDEMGSWQYVAQYIKALQHEAMDILFVPFSLEDFNYQFSSPIGEWINKKDPYDLDYHFDITDILWTDYFHNREFPALGRIAYGEKGYEISGLKSYLATPEDQEFLDINMETSKLFNGTFLFSDSLNGVNFNNLILSELINAELTYLNTSFKVSDKQQYATRWGVEWQEDAPALIFNENINEGEKSKNKNFKLGAVLRDNDKYVLEDKSLLERIIDSGFYNGVLTNKSTEEEVLTFIKRNNYLSSLPPSLQISLSEIIYFYISSNIRAQFQDLFIFSDYQTAHEEELTNDQLDFINTQFSNYFNQIQSGSNWSNEFSLDGQSALFNFIADYNTWVASYTGISEPEELNDTIDKVNNNIDMFNAIISTKNNAIRKFQNNKYKVSNLLATRDLSENIRTVLSEEQSDYDEACVNIKNILQLFKMKQESLAKAANPQGYIDFLITYLDLLNTGNDYKTKQSYKYFIQQAIAMRDKTPEEEYSLDTQYGKVQTAWKNFLDALKQSYKRIEEKREDWTDVEPIT